MISMNTVLRRWWYPYRRSSWTGLSTRTSRSGWTLLRNKKHIHKLVIYGYHFNNKMMPFDLYTFSGSPFLFHVIWQLSFLIWRSMWCKWSLLYGQFKLQILLYNVKFEYVGMGVRLESPTWSIKDPVGSEKMK